MNEFFRRKIKKTLWINFFYQIFNKIYWDAKKIYKIYIFTKNMNEFNKLSREKALPENILPCLDDATSQIGFEPHYTYHPAWAARILSEINPEKHVDISSHFASLAIISAFINIDYYEYRPEFFNLDNIKSSEADLLNLPMEDDSIYSLSCMHVIEHVGLGRYGDEIDPYGDIKAAKELTRVLKKEGYLIVVVPVGKPRIVYNAHRIYSYQQVLDMFKELKLDKFALIPDDYRDKGLIHNPDIEIVNIQKWGCGCFLFKK